MKVQKKVAGYKRIRRKLGRMFEDEAIAHKVIARWLQDLAVIYRRKKYPPKRPNQRYTRTGKLRRRYRVMKETIMNTAPYAPYVIGKKTQARIHRGRWWTFEDVYNEHVPELKERLTKRYIEEWLK